MYLDIKIKVKRAYRFNVPHKKEPMTAAEIEKEFPDFAKLFDGEAKENTLLFYYKLNKREGVFELLDEEAEEEVAELMGVELCTEAYEYEEEAAPEARHLTTAEIEKFKEDIDQIKEGLEWFDKT